MTRRQIAEDFNQYTNMEEPISDREYEALTRRIEERKRIKAMVEDLEKSEKERISYQCSNNARDKTTIEDSYGGHRPPPKRNKIAGDAFIKIQIRNGDTQ